MSEDIVRKRNLPHIDVPGKPYFITACLEGSISAVGLKKIRNFRQHLAAQKRPEHLTDPQWKRTREKLVFKLVDELLDHQSPSKHLARPELAKEITDAFLHFAGERYQLLAFVVMPSHHHWLFLPNEDWWSKNGADGRTPRESISHSIQSFTANKCNRLMRVSGTFWQDETWDHYARDEDEMYRIINYIENNPVAARLAREPSDFHWSSAYLRKELGIEMGKAIQA